MVQEIWHNVEACVVTVRSGRAGGKDRSMAGIDHHEVARSKKALSVLGNEAKPPFLTLGSDLP